MAISGLSGIRRFARACCTEIHLPCVEEQALRPGVEKEKKVVRVLIPFILLGINILV